MRSIGEYDVVWAYMAAAAWWNNVEPEMVMQPSHHAVEEVKNSAISQVWRINSPQERDDHGRFLPALAVCTYTYDTETWAVKLPEADESVEVGYDDDGEMVVLNEEVEA